MASRNLIGPAWVSCPPLDWLQLTREGDYVRTWEVSESAVWKERIGQSEQSASVSTVFIKGKLLLDTPSQMSR